MPYPSAINKILSFDLLTQNVSLFNKKISLSFNNKVLLPISYRKPGKFSV